MPLHAPVAVVGMACRLPGAPDLASYARLLREGRDAVGPIPEGRWNLDALRAFAGGEIPDAVLRGGWLPRVRDLDAAFFRLSPREARTMDPKQRLALEVTHEALEDAHLAPAELQRTHPVGLFLGTAQSEYLVRFYWRGELTGPAADRYCGPGNDASFSSGRISATLGLEGPSLNVNTACSTSLVAVHQALRALADGDCAVAIAGGVAIIETPENGLVMDQFGVLSPDGRCWTFDERANGYVRGEGCGMVVLRPLADALAHGDRIYAVLSGSAVNHNGRSGHLMAPDEDAQVRLLRRTLEVAGRVPRDIDVVEAHGTGTLLGDPVEARALGRVLGEGRDASDPLLVGSVKTNIGHLEVAAGIAGLIKTVLSVHSGEVPAHLHLTRRNPRIPAELPLDFPTTRRSWPERGRPRRALVNSFGISGINAAVIVEQAPAAPPAPHTPERAWTLLPLSAVGPAPLARLSDAYADALTSGLPLAHLAHTAATGRDPQPRRLVVVADRSELATAALRAVASGETHPAARVAEVPPEAPRIAWLLTGQGAQHVGMGRELHAQEPVFREAYDAFDAALAEHLGRSIRAVSWGEDPQADLHDTTWTQPAIVALQIGLGRMWQAWGLQPDVLLGHSIGEIAAAHLAGALDLATTARLVAERSRRMGALPSGGAMLAVMAPASELADQLAGLDDIALAADNGPRACVLAGSTDRVEAFAADLERRNIAVKRLTVSHAFHSPLMDPMLQGFREALADLRGQTPGPAVISTLTAAEAGSALSDPDHWVRHVRAPVRFREGVEAVLGRGVGMVVELGPGSTLLGMARRMARDAKVTWVPSLDPERPLQAHAEAVASHHLAGAPLSWEAWWAHHRTRRVELPRYPYERRPHWVDDPGPPSVLVQRGGVEAAPARPAPAPVTPPPATMAAATWRLGWHPVSLRDGPRTHRGTWIVTTDEAGVGDWVAGGLEREGHTVVRIASRDRGGDVAAQRVDPLDPQAIRSLVAAHGAELRGLVDTRPLDAAAPQGQEPPSWMEAVEQASVGFLHAAQAVVGIAPRARLVLVTRGAQAVADGDTPSLGQTGPWGIARVVALEHPTVGLLSVDLGPEASDTAALVDVVLHAPEEVRELARRSRAWLTPTLDPLAPVGPALTPVPGTSWLITGGLGGLGLRVAAWLVDQGATHLVLAGRSAPGPQALTVLEDLRRRGADVHVVKADVASRADVEALVGEAEALAPLRGVVHAAGVLTDAPLLKQSRGRVREVLAAKVSGAWNLHRATRTGPLDAFVLFSSVTATLGATGQAGYAAANAFLDGLAAARHAAGLPGVAIGWGPWAEVGMAAGLAELMASRGVRMLPPAAALEALGRVGMGADPHVVVLDLKEGPLASAVPASDAPVPARPVAAPVPATPAAKAPPAPPQAAAPPPPARAALPDRAAVHDLAARPAEERLGVLTEALRGQAEQLLGVEPGDIVATRPLAWQGFDSVLAIDLGMAIKEAWGLELPQASLVVGPPVREIAEQLLAALALPAEATSAPPPARSAPPPTPAVPPPSAAPQAPRPVPMRTSPEELARTVARWAEELLGLQPGELDVDRPLAWQGFDSVMAVELQRRIEWELGVQIPLERVVSGPRLSELAEDLQAVQVGATLVAPPAEVPRAEVEPLPPLDPQPLAAAPYPAWLWMLAGALGAASLSALFWWMTSG
ncbi:MAG: SDR family NAD(P)-dependent oxidoreductase [Alphaproteobacteria bacterium]|nr:SDR family NAD(P)-dependent oxidoreductase [Alphaproteobacteria bacterium]